MKHQILLKILIVLSLLGCTPKKDKKNIRYAKKQYFLGHDYFSKYILSLRNIANLRHKTSILEKKLKKLSLSNNEEGSISSIRANKVEIKKNTEIINNEISLSGKYLNAALVELKKAVMVDPKHFPAQFELALIYLKKASSMMDLTKRTQCMSGDFLKEKTEDTAALLGKSKLHFLFSTKNEKLASKSFNNIASIEIYFTNYDNAIAYGKKALKDLIYQEGYVANSNIGWALFFKKEYKTAVSYFKQALLLQPKYCLARYRLGRVYFESELYQLSNKALSRTISQGPPCSNIQEAWLYLGLTQMKLNQIKKAEYTFSRCVELAPSSCIALKCKKHQQLISNTTQ
jgi:Tfp pilus assembly protein PilF